MCRVTFWSNRAQTVTVPLPKPKEKAWQGNYCCVPICQNSSGQREERLPFTRFPKMINERKSGLLRLYRRDPGTNFKVSKHTNICSEHFTSDDFVATMITDLPRTKCCLKANAVPSVFPWNAEVCQRTSSTSK